MKVSFYWRLPQLHRHTSVARILPPAKSWADVPMWCKTSDSNRSSTSQMLNATITPRPATENAGRDFHPAWDSFNRYCAGHRLGLGEFIVHVFCPLSPKQLNHLTSTDVFYFAQRRSYAHVRIVLRCCPVRKFKALLCLFRHRIFDCVKRYPSDCFGSNKPHTDYQSPPLSAAPQPAAPY